MSRLSVVLPAYNEEQMLAKTCRTLKKILDLAEINYELVIVDDGSTDQTWKIIEETAEKDRNVTGVHFSRNFGKEAAIVAGLADKCEIQLSYAIGVAKPTSINVNTFGTGKLSDTKLVEIIRDNFDLRPAGIIRMLDLRRPIYKQTAAYGHFGRTDVDLPWEKLDKVENLKKYL